MSKRWLPALAGLWVGASGLAGCGADTPVACVANSDCQAGSLCVGSVCVDQGNEGEGEGPPPKRLEVDVVPSLSELRGGRFILRGGPVATTSTQVLRGERFSLRPAVVGDPR